MKSALEAPIRIGEPSGPIDQERGQGTVAKRGEGDRGVYTVLRVDQLDELPLIDLRTSLVLVVLGLTFGGLLIWNLAGSS